MKACGEALAECVAATGGGDVLAVSVSAGMHGLVALDAELRPLTPLITWADARARGEARDAAAFGSGRGTARAHRRARASDVATDQADVVLAPRAADAGRRRAGGWA